MEWQISGEMGDARSDGLPARGMSRWCINHPGGGTARSMTPRHICAGSGSLGWVGCTGLRERTRPEARRAMAQKTIVLVEDDVSGGSADESVTFAL